MKRRTEQKLVLVKRKTRLEELKARFNTIEQARFYIEHLGADFNDYQQEHNRYSSCIQKAETILARTGRVQVLERSFLPNYIFGPYDIVIAIGQDGLVANTLKYLNGQPLIGVNPDPARWEGILVPFLLNDLEKTVSDVINRNCATKNVTMAAATLNTREKLLAVNDFFIGPKSHTSARYTIHLAGMHENQSSSGIIVSTGLGSTGWLKSILAGAVGISSSISQNALKLQENSATAWDANYLYFSVREPWPSKSSKAGITFGKITQSTPLIVTSHMPENGVIFSDGIETDFLTFNAGTQATIEIAEVQGCLVC